MRSQVAGTVLSLTASSCVLKIFRSLIPLKFFKVHTYEGAYLLSALWIESFSHHHHLHKAILGVDCKFLFNNNHPQ